jgi:hypothetical protein
MHGTYKWEDPHQTSIPHGIHSHTKKIDLRGRRR